MNKFLVILFNSTFLMAVVLSMTNAYYGSWAFFALGLMLAIYGYIYKGKIDVTACFWFGLLISLVTFVGANVSGKIYSETVKILQENNNQKKYIIRFNV